MARISRRAQRPRSHFVSKVVTRLPIKLGDGRIVQTGVRQLASEPDAEESADELESNEESNEETATLKVEDVSTGARFGRPAVVDVVGIESRAERIKGAKEQIAGICNAIIADPENSLGLLRRLYTFSLKEISTPSHPNPVLNDPVIRRLAILSQLAVFKDIIPGYRIRQLTDKEKAEKVSQIVAQTREWEQGLLIIYRNYVLSLEDELKAKTDLPDAALQCVCSLAVEATHFNYRINLFSCITSQLSRKSWTESSELCLNTVIKIFRADLTGVPSLEIVRLLNRMIKERRFVVNPKVLSALLHLRLKTELSARAPVSNSGPKTQSKSKTAARRAKGKPTEQPHLTKTSKKALKEKVEIDREFREAEAEVDKEERTAVHTETLKLVFVIYFSVLKNPHSTSLLPAALRGISKYAHLVNVDFFEDLMKILKGLISQHLGDGRDDVNNSGNNEIVGDIRLRLLCIVAAFELLSGQGEALNIDLGDFISSLYAIISPLTLMPDIESPFPTSFEYGDAREPVADILFRALNLIFSPQRSGATWRSAAFAKRLLIASLHWPPSTAKRTLQFVHGLIAQQPKLEALLSSDDRSSDGVYRPDINDPQLCNAFGTSFWELYVLQKHCDPRVREEASRLVNRT